MKVGVPPYEKRSFIRKRLISLLPQLDVVSLRKHIPRKESLRPTTKERELSNLPCWREGMKHAMPEKLEISHDGEGT